MSEALKFKDLGNEQFKNKEWKNALDLYSKAIELDSNEPSFYTNRAACHLQLAKYDDAIRDAEKALSIDRKFIKGYFRSGQGLLALGRIDDAYDKFQQAQKIQSGDRSIVQELEKIDLIRVYLKRVEDLREKGKFEESLTQISAALALSPQSIPFKIIKGDLLIDLKRYDEASKVAGGILQYDAGNSSDAMFLRGKALYYLGQAQQGSQLLLTALELDPDNVKCLQFRKKIQRMESLKTLGNDLLKGGEFQKAYEKYTEACEIDPNAANLNSQLYCNRAAAAQKLEDHKLAIEDASKAIELNPQYAKAYQRRIASFMKLEKFEEAMYDLNKVKELEPENRDIARQLKDLQKTVKTAKRKDYYKILGIEKNASSDEIERAYKKQAMANHPDRFPTEEKEERTKIFHDIGEAKAVLTDGNKKAAYDQGADLEDIQNGGGHGFGGFGGGMGGVDISELFNMFGGQGRSSRGGGGGGGFSFNMGGDEGGDPFGGFGGHPFAQQKKRGGGKRK